MRNEKLFQVLEKVENKKAGFEALLLPLWLGIVFIKHPFGFG